MINPYIQGGNSPGSASEQDQNQQIINECIRFNGMDINYCPRKHVRLDEILKEDVMSAFDKNYTIECMVVNVEGFGENTEFLSKFGLYINKTLRLVVSRERFFIETGEIYPTEGALIYFPLGNALFELKVTEDEIPFYQLGANYTFTLVCELFSYSQEELDTGVPGVDDIETTFDNVDSVSNDPFAVNDDFQTEGDRILDDSESNPFGNP